MSLTKSVPIICLVTLFTLVGCSTVPKETYMVVITDTNGHALEDAWVTPITFGKNYATRRTGIDGKADLSGNYPKKPYKIDVRKVGYRDTSADWNLPSPLPQNIMMQKQ